MVPGVGAVRILDNAVPKPFLLCIPLEFCVGDLHEILDTDQERLLGSAIAGLTERLDFTCRVADSRRGEKTVVYQYDRQSAFRNVVEPQAQQIHPRAFFGQELFLALVGRIDIKSHDASPCL